MLGDVTTGVTPLWKKLLTFCRSRGDPGRTVILISIGMVNFPEALCDFGSSVNIIPRVLYEKFFTHPLLETAMCL